jgi:hypothetical protein
MAGLLDTISSRWPEDGSRQPGLLDALVQSFAGQAPSQGFAGPQLAQSAIPQNAQPAIGQMPMQQQAPQPNANAVFGSEGGNLFDRLNAGFQGFANAGSPMQALGNLIGGLTTGQRSDPQGMMLAQQRATFESLRGSGVPPNLAMAAALNPKVLETIAPAYFDTKPQLQETGVDPLTGQKSFGVYRPNQGTLTPINAGENSSGIPGQTGFLNKGVGAVDSNLSGEAYLKQFSPEVQSAVKNYVEGLTMPTGNARQGFTQAVKMIAAKYGNDIGVPADDTNFALRRKMQTDIASSSNNSMGGILSNGKSSFSHLGELADNFAKLGNFNGPNMPGGGMIGSAGNYIGNFMGTPETKGKIAAVNAAALKYGQESTKFYAGTGGGEAERMHALKAMDPISTNGTEQAAFLETEKSLMLDRLREKERQIKDVMGQAYLDKHPVFTPEIQANIDKIDKNIAILRGDGTKTTAPETKPSSLPNGWSVQVK